MSESLEQHYFWDSCVFTAYLKDERNAYDIDSIACFLNDVKEGKAKIYTSTIVIAEVLPSHIKNNTFDEFLDDFQGMIVMVDPSVNIMKRASSLRDIPYLKQSSNKRSLGIADSIMLSTCIELKEFYDININAFHTFDKGKKRGENGSRSIPILTYETWCKSLPDKAINIIQSVIDLPREEPIYQEFKLL